LAAVIAVFGREPLIGTDYTLNWRFYTLAEGFVRIGGYSLLSWKFKSIMLLESTFRL